MFGITDLTTYMLGVICIILVPGPNSLYVLTATSKGGIKRGFQAAGGIFVGDTILMLLSACGMNSLLQVFPAVLTILKYIGGAYLAWVGLSMLKGVYKHWQAGGEFTLPPTPQSDSHPFKTALLISVINPKAIFFFISFFVQFVDPAYSYPALTFLMLGLILQAFSALYLSTLILLCVRLITTFQKRSKLGMSLKGTVGALFVGFGVKLATATLG